MIDFENGSVIKLHKVKDDAISAKCEYLLINGEDIIGVYKTVRDYVVFTNKRLISVNVQGITGKKQDLTSMPYSKITVFSVETAGVFDLDSELEIYFAGVGKVHFDFTGHSDIIEIGKSISEYILN